MNADQLIDRRLEACISDVCLKGNLSDITGKTREQALLFREMLCFFILSDEHPRLGFRVQGAYHHPIRMEQTAFRNGQRKTLQTRQIITPFPL